MLQLLIKKCKKQVSKLVILKLKLNLMIIYIICYVVIRTLIYWRTLKTQHLDTGFNVSKKKTDQQFLFYDKEHSFVSKISKTCPTKKNLMH